MDNDESDVFEMVDIYFRRELRGRKFIGEVDGVSCEVTSFSLLLAEGDEDLWPGWACRVWRGELEGAYHSMVTEIYFGRAGAEAATYPLAIQMGVKASRWEAMLEETAVPGH